MYFPKKHNKNASYLYYLLKIFILTTFLVVLVVLKNIIYIQGMCSGNISFHHTISEIALSHDMKCAKEKNRQAKSFWPIESID